MYQSLEKAEKQLRRLQQKLCNPKAKMRDKAHLENMIRSFVKGQFTKNLIDWSLQEVSAGLVFVVNTQPNGLQLGTLHLMLSNGFISIMV